MLAGEQERQQQSRDGVVAERLAVGAARRDQRIEKIVGARAARRGARRSRADISATTCRRARSRRRIAGSGKFGAKNATMLMPPSRS